MTVSPDGPAARQAPRESRASQERRESAASQEPRAPVLVTGGTGFLGAALTRRLLADGVEVRVLARSPAKARPLADLGAQVAIGDVTDEAAVRAAMDGAHVVYHLAGPLLVPGVPAAEYQRAHVMGTRVVLDCCARAPGLERLVHCSTTGVLGVTGDRPAAEDVPWRPTNMYEQAKADAEAEVRRRREGGLPVVIARPGLVYGPGDIHLLSFFQAIQRGLFLPIGRHKAWLHPIYIDDMTEALVRCGQRRAAIGECFHLAGAEPVPIGELARVIARAEGTRLPPGNIPLPAARVVAGLGDLLPPALRQRAPLTRGRLDFLTHSRMYDVSKARRLLDFAAPTDLPAGIARTVAWYRQHGHLPAPSGLRAFPRKTAEPIGEGSG
ncbi:MAG TPA: NAD-dependent epimerase/dehydratase family protein [Streptosporangiaceae bacterium]|nr:NAD-dependent epimerase/dehydratase family protein [Streptosporangiaceae bacterium]